MARKTDRGERNARMGISMNYHAKLCQGDVAFSSTGAVLFFQKFVKPESPTQLALTLPHCLPEPSTTNREILENQDCADRPILSVHSYTLSFANHLRSGPWHEHVVNLSIGRCRVAWESEGHRETNLAQHGAVDVLPIEQDERISPVEQDEATTISIEILVLLPRGADLFVDWSVGIENPESRSEV